MNTCKRWIAAALSLALTASLSISGSLALAPAEPFADFRIDAIDLDVPDRSIRIATYRRDESGALVYQEARDYDCKVNRVTGDATFYIQPKAEGVQATVDYLTNVTGDDFYELTEDESQPAWDSLSAQGELVSGGSEALAVGQTYILSAETLSARFEGTARARTVPSQLVPAARASRASRVTRMEAPYFSRAASPVSHSSRAWAIWSRQ